MLDRSLEIYLRNFKPYIYKFYITSDIISEANSSIECFNDNDETVLQGETQYKYAE